MRKSLSLIVWISLLTLQPSVLARNPQDTFEFASRRATEATDIFSSGPVEIRAKFHL